jgi:hypothetical protein
MLAKIIRKPAARHLSPQPSFNTPWRQMQNGVFGYEVVVHHGYDGISPLTTHNVMPGLSRVTEATLAASPQSWLSISEIDTGYSSRSSTFSLSEIDSNTGSQRSFGRGDADDTPRAVDAATAMPKQTVRSWRSLSEIDSNTGSQRSVVSFGREDVHDTLYVPQNYAVFGVRPTQRIQSNARSQHPEAVEEVTFGREAADDTLYIALDTATAVDTAAVSQQTEDAPKKPKRSRLLKELKCTLNMDGYWKRGGPRRSTRIALQL